ncbi:MAG: phospholipase [Muribaculaceae bacterium]|nr:phospholipase [Muribaculaceae bacterium]
MQGALVILAAMVVIGVLLFVTDKTYFRHHHGNTHVSPEDDNEGNGTSREVSIENKKGEEICCGLHLVCEKTGLSPVSDEIIYYDDEELDRFAGRLPESYTADETEEFRDVLLTLIPGDVPGWARSMTLRRIELPYEVKEELLMIVSELRESVP